VLVRDRRRVAEDAEQTSTMLNLSQFSDPSLTAALKAASGPVLFVQICPKARFLDLSPRRLGPAVFIWLFWKLCRACGSRRIPLGQVAF